MGQILLMGQEIDYQDQIDRACAAQSPALLPEEKHAKGKLEAARERIKKQKSKYKVPASSIDYNAIPTRHSRR